MIALIMSAGKTKPFTLDQAETLSLNVPQDFVT
jgi:hypothetical protein